MILFLVRFIIIVKNK